MTAANNFLCYHPGIWQRQKPEGEPGRKQQVGLGSWAALPTEGEIWCLGTQSPVEASPLHPTANVDPQLSTFLSPQ